MNVIILNEQPIEKIIKIVYEVVDTTNKQPVILRRFRKEENIVVELNRLESIQHKNKGKTKKYTVVKKTIKIMTQKLKEIEI